MHSLSQNTRSSACDRWSLTWAHGGEATKNFDICDLYRRAVTIVSRMPVYIFVYNNVHCPYPSTIYHIITFRSPYTYTRIVNTSSRVTLNCAIFQNTQALPTVYTLQEWRASPTDQERRARGFFSTHTDVPNSYVWVEAEKIIMTTSPRLGLLDHDPTYHFRLSTHVTSLSLSIHFALSSVTFQSVWMPCIHM